MAALRGESSFSMAAAAPAPAPMEPCSALTKGADPGSTPGSPLARDLLTQVILKGAEAGWYPEWFNKGDVVPLPKGGDRRSLSNKRPITLLNSMYKIYTKALQGRIVPILQKLISWNQSAFLPGRNTHTSVLTCNEALHVARNSVKDFILLQLDFKKAFDSVNWLFVTEALKAFKFGERFQKYIRAILSTAASAIIVNGRRNKVVKITRSVRQGCPLSPLLFILVTQTLTVVIEQEVAAGRIQGIYLEKANMHYCLGLYADDSHMILGAKKEGATQTKNLLDSFANATGLQIQWNKFTARWIGPNGSSKPRWVEELT
ncbi:hypothetical protein R1sor_012961 [Riccia sorocarpa]|uniref:Reverse transcriptase domain-containing protein n=1 Tax=Riccia sorocarpa TaxID=122646 RepID=A0ABD3I917_9MARC